MQGVFTTERAILVHFKSVRIILLVFLRVVITLFAFAARQCYFYSCVISHDIGTSQLNLRNLSPFVCFSHRTSLRQKILLAQKKNPLPEVIALYHIIIFLSTLFLIFLFISNIFSLLLDISGNVWYNVQ